MYEERQVPPEQMRASDADRDATAERLSRALQEGRLTLDEYTDRLEQAMRSVTMGDLGELTSDIPAPPAEPAERSPAEIAEAEQAAMWRRRLEPWRGLASISFILVGIWAITSAFAGILLPFWPLIPIGFMFIFTLAGSVSGHGQEPFCGPPPPPDRGDPDR
ncbi:hypothetical protein F4561_003882 [Lipingzhangella halophila]|uniref:DUF1707 domain-containing protein n=1 Tax=Lipingzhangella halophila TaxID=1783352 RepID=A0A7W7RJD5_9ACTN|nr:DUF1707 domain-containing protein [Lipingzhangella halophila]MBB4933062.1 hypothetical protein [Lipingzhangella halophila]